MTDIDTMLSRLALAPVHTSLAAIDDAVLTRLSQRAAQIPSSAIGLAVQGACTSAFDSLARCGR